MPTLQEEKLNKFKQLLQVATESLTRQEFVDGFQSILKQIFEIEKKLIERMDGKTQSSIDEISKLQKDFSDIIEQAKKESDSTFGGFRKRSIEAINSIFERNQVRQKLSESLEKVADKIKEVNYAISQIRNGEDADEEKIVNNVIAKIPKSEKVVLDTPEKLRDKLEQLKGEERIDLKAIRGLEKALKEVHPGTGMTIFGGNRPLQIQESGTVKDKVARVINFTGASVSRSTDGVITVAIVGGGVETPSGTMNSSNKTFTVLHTPIFLTWQGQMLYENLGYTLSGLTITMDIAPDSGDTLKAHF